MNSYTICVQQGYIGILKKKKTNLSFRNFYNRKYKHFCRSLNPKYISELGSTSSTWVLVWYFKHKVLKIL